MSQFGVDTRQVFHDSGFGGSSRGLRAGHDGKGVERESGLGQKMSGPVLIAPVGRPRPEGEVHGVERFPAAVQGVESERARRHTPSEFLLGGEGDQIDRVNLLLLVNGIAPRHGPIDVFLIGRAAHAFLREVDVEALIRGVPPAELMARREHEADRHFQSSSQSSDEHGKRGAGPGVPIAKQAVKVGVARVGPSVRIVDALSVVLNTAFFDQIANQVIDLEDVD